MFIYLSSGSGAFVPRVIGTVEAIERELMTDGFVLRYPVAEDNPVDGLPGGEGAFLACSFWLTEARAMIGRHDEAVGTSA